MHLPKMRLQMAFLAILMFWNDPKMWILLHLEEHEKQQDTMHTLVIFMANKLYNSLETKK